MEHKIGEIITLTDGRKAEVVDSKNCHFCIFNGGELDNICYARNVGSCTNIFRTDHKNVIYKEVK